MRVRLPAPPPDLAARPEVPDLFAERRRLIRRRRLRVALLGILAVAIVAALTWVLAFSSLLTLRSVEVVGVPDDAVARVLAVAEPPMQTPLARVDTDAVAERIAELPEVQSATVSRSWPRSLLISVQPRTGLATLEVAEGVRLVDESGVVFDPVGDLPTGLPELRVPADERAEPRREAAVRVVADLPPWLASRLASVEAISPSSVTLLLTDGRTIRWGSASESTFKAQVSRILLRESAAVIDVSVPDRPALSGTTPTS